MEQNKICIMGIEEGRKKKGAWNLFEEIMTENFSNLRRKIDIRIQITWKTPTRKIPEEIYPEIKLSKVIENFVDSKRNTTQYIQESSHQIISRFLTIKIMGYKGTGWYSQYTERKTAKQKYCIWQNHPSNMREKSRLPQIKKKTTQRKPSPLDLPYEKSRRES